MGRKTAKTLEESKNVKCEIGVMSGVKASDATFHDAAANETGNSCVGVGPLVFSNPCYPRLPLIAIHPGHLLHPCLWTEQEAPCHRVLPLS